MHTYPYTPNRKHQPMTLPKKAAIIITSYNGPLYPDGKNTGAFYSEVYDPFKAFTDAGFEVDIVTESGKYGWDENSLAPDFAPEEILKASKDPQNPFYKALANVKKASEVNAKDYGLVNAAGGHGTVFDFVGKAPNGAKLAGEVYDNGGLIVAVCHGPCLLPDVKDKNGNVIIKGKNVTGFPDAGEVIMKLVETLDKDNLAYTERVLKAAGANYEEAVPPFSAKVVVDGRVITGANPASATPAAETAIAEFAKL